MEVFCKAKWQNPKLLKAQGTLPCVPFLLLKDCTGTLCLWIAQGNPYWTLELFYLGL